MELNSKVKELEDELKVLKAEIHNVLLDIREVVLDKTNPLAEEHESAFLRMDLNTTARTMAAEAASREAGKAQDEAEGGKGEEPTEDKPDAEALGPASTDKKPDAEAPGSPPDDKKDDDEDAGPPPKGKGSRKGKGAKSGSKAATEKEGDTPLEPADIPAMFRASARPAAGAVALAAWVVAAMKAIGPHELDRVIAIHRLCGNLPPNVSEALAHLQELIRSSTTEEPPWLAVLQDLDGLASS